MRLLFGHQHLIHHNIVLTLEYLQKQNPDVKILQSINILLIPSETQGSVLKPLFYDRMFCKSFIANCLVSDKGIHLTILCLVERMGGDGG